MPHFGEASHNRLLQAAQSLQMILNEAIKEFDFMIAQASRGAAEQERDFKRGLTKVHFGDSAHNWKPSVAVDLVPSPNGKPNWDDLKQFKVLQLEIILPIASFLAIPIRQGIDFNRNGILTDDNWDDLPHLELFPWREAAKHSTLYHG